MKAETSTARELWKQFAHALPAKAPAKQRHAMQRAFYAGAYSVLMELILIADYDAAIGAQKLDALCKEVNATLQKMILEDMHDGPTY